MKKVINLALMATAILLGMTSCSNEDNELNVDTNAPGSMSVMLRLEGSSNTGSRAIGETAKDQTTVLSSGQIIFTKITPTKRFYPIFVELISFPPR